MLSDFGPLEHGIIDQLSGSDHSLKGATPISRRTESVTYREFVSSGLVLTRSAFIVTKRTEIRDRSGQALAFILRRR